MKKRVCLLLAAFAVSALGLTACGGSVSATEACHGAFSSKSSGPTKAQIAQGKKSSNKNVEALAKAWGGGPKLTQNQIEAAHDYCTDAGWKDPKGLGLLFAQEYQQKS